MVFQENFLEAAQKKAAEKRATPEYQEALPRRQFEQILKILGQNEFNISRNPAKDLGEQIVIEKNNDQYQIFILKSECFTGENVDEICQLNQSLKKEKNYISELEQSNRMKELRLEMRSYRNHDLNRLMRARKESQNESIKKAERRVSERQEELDKLKGAVEKRPLRDIMPEFGTWVGGVAPELVEFIGAHLEMSEGHKLSKHVQKVAFPR